MPGLADMFFRSAKVQSLRRLIMLCEIHHTKYPHQCSYFVFPFVSSTCICTSLASSSLNCTSYVFSNTMPDEADSGSEPLLSTVTMPIVPPLRPLAVLPSPVRFPVLFLSASSPYLVALRTAAVAINTTSMARTRTRRIAGRQQHMIPTQISIVDHIETS